jgi:carbamate kinase
VAVDKFVIKTDVAGVALDFGNENQRFLGKLSIADTCQYMEHGHFDKGSMGPKVEAAARFVKNTGKRAEIISIYNNVEATVVGKAGTEFII